MNLSTTFTLEAVVSIDKFDTSSSITIMGNTDSGGGAIFVSSTGIPRITVYANGSYQSARSSTALKTGQKYHLYGTCNGSTICLYVDGTLVASQSVTKVTQPTNNTVMALGCDPTGSSIETDLAKMKLYSAKVYDVALTASQISSNVNMSTSNQEWKKSHSVTVTVGDATSGLASGASVKYGWSTSSTVEPTSYKTASLSYSSGAKTTTFTATGSGMTGKYYLWVVPTTLKDVAGNSNTDKAVSSQRYWFDNQSPKIEMETELVKSGLLRSYSAANNTGSGYSGTTTTWKDLAGYKDGTLSGGTWSSSNYLLLDGTDDWVNCRTSLF